LTPHESEPTMTAKVSASWPFDRPSRGISRYRLRILFSGLLIHLYSSKPQYPACGHLRASIGGTSWRRRSDTLKVPVVWSAENSWSSPWRESAGAFSVSFKLTPSRNGPKIISKVSGVLSLDISFGRSPRGGRSDTFFEEFSFIYTIPSLFLKRENGTEIRAQALPFSRKG